MKLQRTLFSVAATALVATSAWAKPFKTQFISLQLPPNWDCKQEEIDWVCQPENLSERAEAIIVIVTKATNEVDDTFPKYEETLKAPRPMRDLLGNSYMSQVKYTKLRDIKGQQWVDSLHFGSEIPGFYTRYVASIKDKISGMVTYSIAESVMPKYSGILDQMVESLEIFFDPKAFADAMKSSPGSLLTKHKNGTRNLAPTLDGEAAKKPGGESNTGLIAGVLLIAAAGGYLWWKKKKGGSA